MTMSTAYPSEIDGSLLRNTSPILYATAYLFSYHRALLVGDFGYVVGIRTLQSANVLAKRITTEVHQEEIKLLASLSHRNILPVIGFVRTDLLDSIRLITELPALGVMEGFLGSLTGNVL